MFKKNSAWIRVIGLVLAFSLSFSQAAHGYGLVNADLRTKRIATGEGKLDELEQKLKTGEPEDSSEKPGLCMRLTGRPLTREQHGVTNAATDLLLSGGKAKEYRLKGKAFKDLDRRTGGLLSRAGVDVFVHPDYYKTIERIALERGVEPPNDLVNHFGRGGGKFQHKLRQLYFDKRMYDIFITLDDELIQEWARHELTHAEHPEYTEKEVQRIAPLTRVRKAMKQKLAEITRESLVVSLDDRAAEDVALTGGKGANLIKLRRIGAPVPAGGVVTTRAYDEFLRANPGLRKFIEDQLATIKNYESEKQLFRASSAIKKKIVEEGKLPEALKKEIQKLYDQIAREAKIDNPPVAVRSSATAEDTAEASFAGQHDTYLHVRGIDSVLDSTLKCIASLFNKRAIYYRHEKGFEHMEAKLAVVIQRMVQSAAAGVAFTVEPDTRLKDGATIEVGYNLGESVVGGKQTPDRYVETIGPNGRMVILEKELGPKEVRIVAKEGGGTVEEPVPQKDRERFVLEDTVVDELAREIFRIRKAYREEDPNFEADIEFAFDENGKLWITQCRAETVHSRKSIATIEIKCQQVKEEAAKKGNVLLESKSKGTGAACGRVVLIDPKNGDLFLQLAEVGWGDVMVASMTTPDMVPAMKRAGAIVTDAGGATSHAAIISRELGVPCVIGTGNATSVLKEGMVVTVEANKGKVFEGRLPLVDASIQIVVPALPATKTKTGLIIANPRKMWEMAALAMRPKGKGSRSAKWQSHYGVSLLRAEFALGDIGVHPLALIDYDRGKIKDEELKQRIADKIAGYKSAHDFYVKKLSRTIAAIAAANRQDQIVIYRTTDFKSNEYKELIGGEVYESEEANPMMGYRGLGRMLSRDYSEAFEWEAEAINRARDVGGYKNIAIMFPVVRTPEELERGLAFLKSHGLERSKDLKIGMMVEVPSNVFQSEEFFKKGIDFMSIGSNDLTQFMLAVGRDNEKMEHLFDETNPAVLKALEVVIRNGRELEITTGYCGQRPSNDPSFCKHLVGYGIHAIGLSPPSYKEGRENTADVEAEGIAPPQGLVALSKIPRGHPEGIKIHELKASYVLMDDIGIHPLALRAYDAGKLEDEELVKKIKKKVGKEISRTFFIDTLTAKIEAAIETTPDDTLFVYGTSDLSVLGYQRLLGGELFEASDANPIVGYAGLTRVTDTKFQRILRWELEALKKAVKRVEIRTGVRRNFAVKFNLVRTIRELKVAFQILKDEGLHPGRDGFSVGMSIDTPANALLIDDFLQEGKPSFIDINESKLKQYILAADRENPRQLVLPKEADRALEIPKNIVTNAAERHKVKMAYHWKEVSRDTKAIKVKAELAIARALVDIEYQAKAAAKTLEDSATRNLLLDALGGFKTDEEPHGIVFSNKTAFLPNGLGVILPGLAKALSGRGRIAVIVESEADERVIRKLNQGLPEENKILMASNAVSALAVLRGEGAKYIKLVCTENEYVELKDTSSAFNRVILAQTILTAMAEVTTLTTTLDEFKRTYATIRHQL